MLSQLSQELNPKRLLPSLTAGIVIGVLEVVVAISFAALIFTGELSGFVANGVGMALFGAIASGLMITLFTSLTGTVGGDQDVPAAIMAVMVTAVVATMPPETDVNTLFVTAVVALTSASFLTGLFLLTLGYFKLGGLVRFLPYPVIGGFLAGSGWLIFIGGIGVMADTSVTLSNLPLLMQPELLIRWLPGLLFGVLLFVLLKKIDHFLVTPGLLIGGVLLFYIVMLTNGHTIASISDAGWLLGPFPAQSLFQPLSPSTYLQIEWQIVAQQGVHIATIVFISAIALLLNASGLEVAFAKDVSLDQELRVAGIANILASFGNGFIGFQQLSLSSLNLRLGAVTRLSGLISVLVSAGALFAGASLLSFFPKIIVGGLLLFLGISFLYEWVYEAWFNFPRIDYAVILLILLVIATVGFLQGVGIGVIATIVLFVVNYSRIRVVRYELTGISYKSRMTYSNRQRTYLDTQGDKLYILRLQGFIFFGTADNLLNQIRERLRDEKRPLPHYILLDFRRVTGLDSTASLSFNKMQQLAQTHQFKLLFIELPSTMKRQLQQGGLQFGENAPCFTFPDLDQGAAWCEAAMLADSDYVEQKDAPLEEILVSLAGGDPHILGLPKFLEKQSLPAGHFLMRQGERTDSLYFVESGQITAYLIKPDHEPIRLETMGNGHIVGEIGFYLGEKRSASVVTDMPSTVYRFSQEAFDRMQRNDPQTAAAFHKLIVRLLSNRVTHLVGIVDAFQQ